MAWQGGFIQTFPRVPEIPTEFMALLCLFFLNFIWTFPLTLDFFLNQPVLMAVNATPLSAIGSINIALSLLKLRFPGRGEVFL